jgi:anti-sigma-K factor RskA
MADAGPGADHVDVAGYVLGALTEPERQAFEQHVASCPSCRRDLEHFRDLPVLLDEAARVPPPQVEPPPDLEARVLGAIAREPDRRPEPAPRVQPVRPVRRRPGWGPAWVGAAAAALVLAFAGGIGTGRVLPTPPQSTPAPTAPPAQTIHLVAANGSAASGTATLRTAGGQTAITMTARDLPPPPPGHVYTCWLVAPDDTPQHQDRVSVGTFTTPSTQPVTLRWDTAADRERFPNLGVTLEPQNGNPAKQGPKVLSAA